MSSEAPERIFRLGLDFGQRQDASALCLVEENGPKAIVKALVKYPLGTGYPMVAETVVNLYRSVSKTGTVWSFAADATGVGTVPAAMIQEMLPECRVEAFIFTNKSKRELVGKVRVLHAVGRLKFAKRKGDDYYNQTLGELILEMKQLQARVIREDADNPEIEVFKTGRHDDLFTALALAVKDVPLGVESEAPISFIEDKTWVQTPLNQEAPLFFTE